MLHGFNLPAAVNDALGLSLDTHCESGIRLGGGQWSVMAESTDTDLRERLDGMLASLNALCCSEPEPAGDPDANPIIAPKKSPVCTQRETIEEILDQLNISASNDESLPGHKPEPTPHTAPHSIVDASAQYSDDVKELIQWGKNNQANRCNDAAEACWVKAHQLAPRNVVPLLHLALLARNCGEHEKTVQLMQEAIQLKPDDAGLHYHLARALNDCDKPEQALKLARHGLTLQHDHCDLQHLQLNLLLSLDNPLEARDMCNQALSLFPDDVRFMKIMVRLAEIDNDSDTAMIWFRRSVVARTGQDKTYRKALLQAMKLVPPDQLPALSSRVIDELSRLNSDARPDLRAASVKGTTDASPCRFW